MCPKYYQNTNNIRFAKHHAFLFLLYDVINRRRSGLGYHLLKKTRFWEETHAQVDSLSLEDLNKAAAEIKTTGKCTNPAILTLERYVQIVASRSPHSFAKCAEQNLFIRSLMISDGMSTVWITRRHYLDRLTTIRPHLRYE